jgi:CRISPR-associated endoribonuclease Cas6
MTMLLSTVLNLTPQGPQTAPPSTARAAHSWLLSRLADVDPPLAEALHEPNALRPFTVSSLWGAGPVRQGQVSLDPGRPVWLRFTALTAPLAAALESALPSPGEVLDLAGARLAVESVARDEEEHPWAGRATYAGLLQRYSLSPDPAPRGVTLRFASPTLCRSQGRDLPLPLPGLLFDGLLRKWNAFSPITLPQEAKRYAEECTALGRFRLRSHLVDLSLAGKGAHVGYTGQVRFRFLTGDAYWARVMCTLAAYAFWAGTGYRTTAGLGQTQRVEEG